MVDLSHARIGLLRDDPATWPAALYLDGLTYQTMSELDDRAGRLRWLRLEPNGFRPQAYTQLAQVYRSAGRDDDARTVLLAGERHRRDILTLPRTVVGPDPGPDRRIRLPTSPGRRARQGPTVHRVHLHPGPDPARHRFRPAVDIPPARPSIRLAYALITAGLLLVTTIAAAGARQLRRD